MAMLAYMIAPLARGDSPRWGTMSIVTASVIPGVGAAITVWKHHRYESYTQLSASLIVGGESAERQAFKFVEVHAQLQCECYLAVFVVVASVAGIIFFAAIAPGMQACAHATCGADVSWSAITLCGGVMWVVATRLGLKWANKASVRAMNSQLEAMDEISQAGREMSLSRSTQPTGGFEDENDVDVTTVTMDIVDVDVGGT